MCLLSKTGVKRYSLTLMSLWHSLKNAKKISGRLQETNFGPSVRAFFINPEKLFLFSQLTGRNTLDKCKKNYYTVTGYLTAGSQSVYDRSSWHSFKPENGHVGQVVAKNKLHVCKEHIQYYNISKN